MPLIKDFYTIIRTDIFPDPDTLQAFLSKFDEGKQEQDINTMLKLGYIELKKQEIVEEKPKKKLKN